MGWVGYLVTKDYQGPYLRPGRLHGSSIQLEAGPDTFAGRPAMSSTSRSPRLEKACVIQARTDAGMNDDGCTNQVSIHVRWHAGSTWMAAKIIRLPDAISTVRPESRATTGVIAWLGAVDRPLPGPGDRRFEPGDQALAG